MFITTMRVRRLRQVTRNIIGLESPSGDPMASCGKDSLEVTCHGRVIAVLDHDGVLRWQHPELTPVAGEHLTRLGELAVDVMGWTESAGLTARGRVD